MNMEAINKKTFIDYSKKIACHFLQTAVTVDDQLVMSARKPIVIDEIIEPDNTGLGAIESNTSDSTLVDHCLDYQTLSVEFAKKGIVCSGLMPKESDSFNEKVDYITGVINNSDLSIIDWEIGDKGNLAKSVIAAVAKNDFESGGQLRLISVYTGSNAKDIAEQIGKEIQGIGLTVNVNESYIEVSRSGEKSFWRVVLISKNASRNGSAEQDLPDRLIEEFSNITAGLLSNATLAAIGEIRNSTHKLLARFNSTLDSAYISHLIGLISIEHTREQAHQIAFDYAADLIAEQMKSEIQVSPLLKISLEKDALGTWPEWKNPETTHDKFEIKTSDNSTKKISNILTKKMLTFSTQEEAIDIFEKDLSLSPNALKKFASTAVEFKFEGESNQIYVELSALEATRRDTYPGSNSSTFIPVLKQGSVLKDINCERFYICLQPLCDSVRIIDNTFFLLVEVFENEKFTHALRTTNGYIKLKIDPKTAHVRSFAFRPCKKSRVVLAKEFNSQYIFTASHNNMNFNIQLEWLGELKSSIAQSLATNLTGNLGRIGLDTFEWLRRKK